MCTYYTLNQGLSWSALGEAEFKWSVSVLQNIFWTGGGGRPWLIYDPLWTHSHYKPPTFLCARLAAHCKSNLLLEIFGHGLSSVSLGSIFIKTLTLTLFPSIKNLPDSWDGCRVFAVHCSPGATWAVQCHAGCRRAVRHTRVQLLDFHITTDCWGGLLTV